MFMMMMMIRTSCVYASCKRSRFFTSMLSSDATYFSAGPSICSSLMLAAVRSSLPALQSLSPALPVPTQNLLLLMSSFCIVFAPKSHLTPHVTSRRGTTRTTRRVCRAVLVPIWRTTKKQ